MYTFNKLVESSLDSEMDQNYQMLIKSIFNIAYVKAVQAGKCTSDRNVILSEDALDFILSFYSEELDKLAKKLT